MALPLIPLAWLAAGGLAAFGAYQIRWTVVEIAEVADAPGFSILAVGAGALLLALAYKKVF